MKSKYSIRIIGLLALFLSFLPANHANAFAAAAPPPVDMFQLPWDLGKAWVAIDGLDNGSKRPVSSSHNYKLGGAIDFAPHNNMITGEDTSNFWVTAAAAGTVIQTASCYVTIAHDNGWITQYQFLAKIQVKLGDVVARNQRLAIIADGVKYKYCAGYQDINVPHLHFILRPSIIGASFAGWEVKYSSLFNTTNFTKGSTTVGLYKPLLNVFDSPATSTPSATATQTQTATATTPPVSETPSATPSPTLTSSVLTLSKTANPQTYGQVGDSISYSFTITNTGATPLGPAQFMINDNKFSAPIPCGPADAVIATNQNLTCTANYSITQADMSVDSLTNVATASGAGQTSAPASATITNLTRIPSVTPTLSGPYVSTVVNPPEINVGETALVTVSLNNVPTEGYTSAEFTCTYDPNLFEVSNITAGSLFGPDPATAINGPQNGNFIFAIAANDGNRATTSGAVFTFSIKGLQPGQMYFGCDARVSTGNNTLTQIPSARAYATVLGSTPTPNLTPSTPTVLPSTCDRAEFIADVNVPPGTVMSPGATFTKTWRLKNVGECTWTTVYQLVFFYGEQMGAVSSAPFPANVVPGQTVDVSLNMTAPNAAGSYRGYWMFRNSSGQNFGIGPDANQPWFVDIVVSGATLSPTATFTPLPPSFTPTPSQIPSGPSDTPTPSVTPGGPIVTPMAGVAYDFAANACVATWFSGAGQLPCPGVDGDPKGFVLQLSNPHLETGVTDTRPGLLTFPQNVQNGYIQGFYPPFHVQNGDRFRSVIDCEYGATDCYVAFRLDYQIGSDPIKTFWGPFLERYDGQYFSVDTDLSSLAGKDVKFILTVLSSGIATGDRAQWVSPIIYRAAGPTATPTATIPSDWLTYTNSKYDFQFLYPSQGEIVTSTDNHAFINLPRAPGTNLGHKYLEVIVAENADPCQSPLATESMLETSETVVINGISFLKQTGQDGTAGHINKWTAYSTSRANICVSLDFVLRAADPGVFTTPPPLYDEAAESAVFGQITSSYQWLGSASTSTPTATQTPTAEGSPTSTFTATPTPSATAGPGDAGMVSGKVMAGKPVTVNVYDSNNTLVGSAAASSDGSFSLEALPGNYTVIVTASGFLSAQGSITLTAGNTITLPTISLLAGDIDNNNVIDQFDALTIGMSYNMSTPTAADLNNDGIINVLDLELLAKNYRKTGPVTWQ